MPKPTHRAALIGQREMADYLRTNHVARLLDSAAEGLYYYGLVELLYPPIGYHHYHYQYMSGP